MHQAAVKSTNTGFFAATASAMRAREKRSQPSKFTPVDGPPEAEAAVAGPSSSLITAASASSTAAAATPRRSHVAGEAAPPIRSSQIAKAIRIMPPSA